MAKRRKLKKEFVGGYVYCPKKTILSDNLPADLYRTILKLDPNLFEPVKNASTKKNTKFPQLGNDKL